MPGIQKEFVIANKLGLHARASATLVRVATQFRCEVTLSKGDQSVNAKSILGMLTLAAATGSTVVLGCAGEDEEGALLAVGKCIEDKFGEE